MRLEVATIAADGYFASGLNDPGEVRGVTLSGYHPGISCAELRTGLLDEVEACMRDFGGRAFVDSGAFSEFEGEPIGDAAWHARLDVYERLAKSCGGGAYLVAPDKVGDQQATLERLRRYAPRLRAMLAPGEWHGPHLIVPVQGGDLVQADFAAQALDALELPEQEVVWGIPSKRAATTLRELAAFARSCAPNASFHLLGMGPFSPRFEAAVLTILHWCPDAQITCDAVRITALVGRGEGVPRPLTAAQDADRLLHPEASSSARKARSLEQVLGDESVRLLLDSGWTDPELPPPEPSVPHGERQLSLLAAAPSAACRPVTARQQPPATARPPAA